MVEEYVPRHELERSEFYNDFLRPIGTRSAVGVGVDGNDGRSLLISLMTPDAKEEDLIPLARQLERISPHLQRAGEFYRQTSLAARATELGATFFEALQLGVVVVGAGRRIRTSSDQARRLFGRDVGIDALGRLRLADPVAQTALIAMLGAKYVGPRTHRLPVGNLMVTLIRMEGDRERSLFEGPGVCLTMEAISGGGRVFDMDRFCRAYGLTPGEIRVLTGLIAGKSVTEIAREAGRSRETIRSQLKSLCGKTGAHGQSDLLRIVSGMAS